MSPTAVKMKEMLDVLEEDDYKMAMSYIQYLYSERKKKLTSENASHSARKNVDAIADSLVGILPDDGRTLEDYREERLKKYEIAD